VRTRGERRPYAETEAGLQEAMVEALRLRGRVVLVTSRRAFTGRGEGLRRRGDGADRGIGDLLVHQAGPTWIMLEVKTPAGRLSPEQRALVDAGRMVVVRSVDEALAIVEAWKGRQ